MLSICCDLTEIPHKMIWNSPHSAEVVSLQTAVGALKHIAISGFPVRHAMVCNLLPPSTLPNSKFLKCQKHSCKVTVKLHYYQVLHAEASKILDTMFNSSTAHATTVDNAHYLHFVNLLSRQHATFPFTYPNKSLNFLIDRVKMQGFHLFYN